MEARRGARDGVTCGDVVRCGSIFGGRVQVPVVKARYRGSARWADGEHAKPRDLLLLSPAGKDRLKPTKPKPFANQSTKYFAPSLLIC